MQIILIGRWLRADAELINGWGYLNLCYMPPCAWLLLQRKMLQTDQ
ncbi:hypothetical protein AC35_5245 [Escherichia coli 3-475-03_S3_C2]|nr:putative bacteriophage protein [Escherichia coli DEC5B]EKI20122.1 putative bacteriophage protein [Escherichia coli TW15901]EKI28616.1 putative bacteriophage protein [Escherichia coli TW00353]EKI29225.1 phage antitermination protein [Escherichia coli ARS4.2123]KDT49430.1 hypothetical protein AB76_5650 [Escherichia coli 3-267-03_S1_C3]KEK74038.1 hypothetical protein AC35_5568 [Escherichia coli 3-475-03_S3_C2]